VNLIEQFQQESLERIRRNEKNDRLKDATYNFMRESLLPQYSYNFSWMGRPIIQYPQDMIAMQEIIWQVNRKYQRRL